MSDEARAVLQAAVAVVVDAALRIIQNDPHQWSKRPCESCRAVSSLVGKPFGCYEFQRNNP